MAYFFMLNRNLAADREKPADRPVEIVVAMQKDEPRQLLILPEQKPVVAKVPEPVQEKVIVKTVKQPPEIITARPKTVQPVVPKKVPAEPKLPPVKVKQRVVRKKVPAPKPIVAVAPVVPRQTKPNKITIPPPSVTRRNYARKDIRETKDDSAPQLKTGANIYTHNQPDNTARPTILKSNVASRRYVSKTNALLPAVKASPPRTNEQIQFSGSQISSYQKPGKRHGFKQRDQRTLHVPQSTNQQLAFPSRKQAKDELLSPLATNKIVAKTKQTVAQSSGADTRAHDFPDTVARDDIDPSELVSLQAFNVCKDPEREFQQKTQLAAHFLKPARIEAQGVVFFVKYTESGYTIQVHVYNPHGRPFRDRCEVLDLAIDRSINRVN